jgi:hypothetical protein
MTLKKGGAEAGLKSLGLHCGGLGKASGFPPTVGLHTAFAHDLDPLNVPLTEASAHLEITLFRPRSRKETGV